MPDSNVCSICGQPHQGAPLSWGPDAPLMWTALPETERTRRGELGTDQCVIDDQYFFIRGRIEIPVTDTGDVFAWLVWVRVSADNFTSISDLWTVAGREKESPLYDGCLANELSSYSQATLDLAVRVHTRSVGERPFIEVIGDHQLGDEQRNGISSHHVQQIADKLLNQADG
jgi:hypothetical protein